LAFGFVAGSYRSATSGTTGPLTNKSTLALAIALQLVGGVALASSLQQSPNVPWAPVHPAASAEPTIAQNGGC
jgi:hypothetical protein